VVVALAKVPLGPLPPAESPDTVNTWAAELSAMNHPRAPLVAALLDPTSPTASDQVAAALAVDPTDADARLAAARVAWRGGDPVEGLAALRTLVREHPTHTVARVLLAAWDLELGHPEESLRLLGVVVRSRPDDEALEAWFREAQAAYTPADRQKRQVDRAFQRP
jgi:predicted Zn-dependent protease